MRGSFRLYRDGKLWCARHNLVVNAALVAAANLTAGVTSGQFVSLMGFGSGTTTPAIGDAGLSGAAQYYNAVTGHTFPSAGSVTFSYAITPTDYGAVPGITVNELGLFGNTGAVGTPISIGIVTAAWAASTAEAVGAIIKDSNGNVQRCTTAGTSGSTHPAWPTTVGGTVTDGGATWTCVALSTAPVPMWTHALTVPFAFNGTATYAGSYTITY